MNEHLKYALEAAVIIVGASLFGLLIGSLKCNGGNRGSCRLSFVLFFAVLALCAVFIDSRRSRK